MHISRLIFWEPSLSPHKTAFITNVAALRPEVEVLYVSQTELADERANMGWAIGNINGFRIVIQPNVAEIENIISVAPDSSLHVFSGIRHVPIIVIALRFALQKKLFFAIMSEPRVSEGISGAVRYFHSWITEHNLRQRCNFVLAIGKHGPPWFNGVGYNAFKIFPFAYFVEGDEIDYFMPPTTLPTSQVIAYVGRLIPMKGVDLLIEAVSKIERPVELLILGDGPNASTYKSMAKRLGVIAHFEGIVPIGEVAGRIRNCDCLALPSISTNDGWGVVVSEALLAGLPVVVSDRVGASQVLFHPGLGQVVRAGSVTSLKRGIDNIFEGAYCLEQERRMRSKWARQHLSAKAGAINFWLIVDHIFNAEERPAPYYC